MPTPQQRCEPGTAISPQDAYGCVDWFGYDAHPLTPRDPQAPRQPREQSGAPAPHAPQRPPRGTGPAPR